MIETQPQIDSEVEVLYCTVHPSVETSLRCNKCGRPMCTRCAVHTPVGYRCRECVRGQQASFYNAGTMDSVVQGAISVILGAIAGGLVSLIGLRLGFIGWFITFWAGSAAGALIADIAHRAVGRRRSRYSWLVVAGGVGLGALIVLPLALLGGTIIGWGIYGFMAVSAAVGRLRFGR